jgi:hypothetical protein
MDDKKKSWTFLLHASRSDIGLVSEEFETRHNGAYEVSPGTIGPKGHERPDPGGVSYGTYQLTSQYIDKKGVHPGGQVRAFLDSKDGKPFRDHFKDAKGHDLKPGAEQFSTAWKGVKDGEAFAAAQYSYVGKTFYNPHEDKLNAIGFDLDQRSVTLQSDVVSASVQHGMNSDVVVHGIKNEAQKLHKKVSELTDEECISGIYAAREKENKNTPGRYAEEKKYSLDMLDWERHGDGLPPTRGQPRIQDRAVERNEGHAAEHADHPSQRHLGHRQEKHGADHGDHHRFGPRFERSLENNFGRQAPPNVEGQSLGRSDPQVVHAPVEMSRSLTQVVVGSPAGTAAASPVVTPGISDIGPATAAPGLSDISSAANVIQALVPGQAVVSAPQEMSRTMGGPGLVEHGETQAPHVKIKGDADGPQGKRNSGSGFADFNPVITPRI